MQLAQTAGQNTFTAYGEGYVSVNAVRHSCNLVVLPDRLIPDWTQASFATLDVTDSGTEGSGSDGYSGRLPHLQRSDRRRTQGCRRSYFFLIDQLNPSLNCCLFAALRPVFLVISNGRPIARTASE